MIISVPDLSHWDWCGWITYSSV